MDSPLKSSFLLSCSIFFVLDSNGRYTILLHKAACRFLGFGFWEAGKQVLSELLVQFEPFLLLLGAFLSQLSFKFATLLIMNN